MVGAHFSLGGSINSNRHKRKMQHQVETRALGVCVNSVQRGPGTAEVQIRDLSELTAEQGEEQDLVGRTVRT